MKDEHGGGEIGGGEAGGEAKPELLGPSGEYAEGPPDVAAPLAVAAAPLTEFVSARTAVNNAPCCSDNFATVIVTSPYLSVA